MIKIKDIVKYQRYQRKRSRRALKNRIFHKLWRKARNRSEQGVSKNTLKQIHFDNNITWRYDTIIKAPIIFSFINNTEEVIRFIQSLEYSYESKKKVYVDLLKVTEIDYSAIVVLLSIMVKFKASDIQFNGNFPQDHISKELLIRSGFFENLDRKFKIEERYEIPAMGTGGIHTHAYKRVDSELGDQIIKSASRRVWGEERRCQGIQRALLELMQNTNNHAEIGKEGEKHWWLAVNHYQNENKVCFAFVDFGVGIFKSLENKQEGNKWHGWKDKIAKLFTFDHNVDILKLILNGDFHSTVTGKNYRGKGLPGIALVQKRNWLSDLRIISNNVYCLFDNSDFRKLKRPFNGTFIYWELNGNNASCKSN